MPPFSALSSSLTAKEANHSSFYEGG